jgi:hypothetical protein
VTRGHEHVIPHNQTVHLALDRSALPEQSQSAVRVGVHGCEVNLMGDVFLRPRSERTLLGQSRGQPLTWEQIANATGTARRNVIVRFIVQLFDTLGKENSPLGFVDPAVPPAWGVTRDLYNLPYDHLQNPTEAAAYPAGHSEHLLGARFARLAGEESTGTSSIQTLPTQCVPVEEVTDLYSERDYQVVIHADVSDQTA